MSVGTAIAAIAAGALAPQVARAIQRSKASAGVASRLGFPADAAAAVCSVVTTAPGAERTVCETGVEVWLKGLIALFEGNLGAPTWKPPYNPYADDDLRNARFWTRSNLLIGRNASDMEAARETMLAAQRQWPKALGICWYPVPRELARSIRGDSPALVWPCASWAWKTRGYSKPTLVQQEPAYYPPSVTRYIVGTAPRSGQGTGQLCWSVETQRFVETAGNKPGSLSLLLKPGHHLVSG